MGKFFYNRPNPEPGGLTDDRSMEERIGQLYSSLTVRFETLDVVSGWEMEQKSLAPLVCRAPPASWSFFIRDTNRDSEIHKTGSSAGTRRPNAWTAVNRGLLLAHRN